MTRVIFYVSIISNLRFQVDLPFSIVETKQETFPQCNALASIIVVVMNTVAEKAAPSVGIAMPSK